MKIHWFFFIVLLLTACQPAAVTKPVSEDNPFIESTQKPDFQVTSVPTMMPAESRSSASLGQGVLATEWREDEHWLVALDPSTGEMLQAAEPIRLGENYFSTFTPDGSRLVLFAFTPKVTLYQVNLLEWSVIKTELPMKRPPYFSVIRSNLDGQKLAVASGDDRSRITLVDLDTSTVSASEVVGFQVSAMQFTQDGSGLMVYGTPAQGSTQGDPQVVLLAADDLQPVWQESISGIKDGIYPKDSTATNLHEPGAAEMYRPGIAFAPNQDVLYLVHSDAPLLTTVDFKARTSVIKEIKPQLSWIDRLMHLTAGIAHAKIIDGTLKQAVISADGSHLFVVGMVNEFKPLKNGEFELVQTPLAMQSIDTRDGALLVEVPALPSNSGWFELSMMSDDQFLILKSFENTKTETHLYDSNTLQLVEAIPNMEVHASRNLSGQPVLVGIRYNSRGFGAVMEAYSPNSLDSLGSWKPAGSFFWLRP